LPASFLDRVRRPARTSAAVVAAVAATATLTLTGPAIARGVAHAVAAPPANPTSDSQIQNIDQVKTAIKGYYGDTVTSAVDPVSGSTPLHTFDPDGAYAQQMGGIVQTAERYLRNADQGHQGHGQGQAGADHATKAILLDVDDTTLNTYNYEIYSNFVYNPTTNAAFVNSAAFPAVPGMIGLVDYAKAHGYQVFYLTGRPESQRAGTVQNLGNVGYAAPDAGHLFLRNKTTPPAYLPCEPTCTTIQYKSLTREHIESLGYDIVANFGDQFSDLKGGYADQTFKLPNPMYYLP
jgi:putative acid phosphatase of HAD superfamily subfamily IIIB